MRNLLVAIGLSAFLFHSPVQANGAKNFGLGVVFGEPTALTGKYWTTSNNAIDFGMAFSTSHYVLLYGDYLFHYYGTFGASSRFASQLSPYVGVGGILAFSSSSDPNRNFFRSSGSSLALGVRIPLGIEWLPRDPSIGVFVELVPGVVLFPATGGMVEGGLGIRYYF